MNQLRATRTKTVIPNHGITLIELLVVIVIIGVLTLILLPAVQAARETARKTTCANHLKQIGLAAQTHHDTHGHFPTGGWGYRWVGDPDRGFQMYQPGGWIYNTLPFLEQQNLRALGEQKSATEKRAALAEVIRTPLPVLHCPSRRRASLYPYLGQAQLSNADLPQIAAKCDYASNGGDAPYDNRHGGPASLDNDTVASFPWPNATQTTGMMYLGSEVRTAMVTDGLSQTYLVGEKHVSRQPHDASGRDPGDDQTMYLGDDRDIRRWTDEPVKRDSREHASTQFGSAHAGGCQFVFCDGSVQMISFSIDLAIHRSFGNRSDGAPAGGGSP